jgi:hypothetical protein
MTSENHCYSRAHGMRMSANGTHISDGLFDISGPLLLPPTIATGDMTSDDHCYYWTHRMNTVATSTHSIDWPCDIR